MYIHSAGARARVSIDGAWVRGGAWVWQVRLRVLGWAHGEAEHGMDWPPAPPKIERNTTRSRPRAPAVDPSAAGAWCLGQE